MHPFVRRALGAWVVSVSLCAAPARAAEPAIQVTATLVTPRDVEVVWTDATPGVAGHIVEFINRPTDEWVILGFVPAGQHTFRHPRLAPQTPYRYRVRSFAGPTSPSLSVTVAAGLSDRAYADAYAKPEDYSWAPPRQLARPGDALRAQSSVRGTQPALAAPADLKAELMTRTVSGFRLTWADRASDEEGFLLERLDGDAGFTVCAVVPPNTTSFGWALEPPQRRGLFRLRAYYFGESSPVVSVITGPDVPTSPHTPSAPVRGASDT